jgi:carbonic anhydrase
MNAIDKLIDNNRTWAHRMSLEDPDFFPRLARQQSPEYLWIGCSDSRVPANEIVGLQPGELFVHRNVANVVVPSDLNCASVVQFAVEKLKVKHIIVTGHYGCAGVLAALDNQSVGIADYWIAHVRSVRTRFEELIDDETPPARRGDLLVELNVIEQALNVGRLPVVLDAWRRGQPLEIHSWVYGLADGLVRDLGASISSPVDQAALRSKVVADLLVERARYEATFASARHPNRT